MPIIRKEALDWLGEAESDLRHATQASKFRSYNWACFAAEQAAEKAIKAFLIGVLKRRPIHLHDLTALCKQTGGKLRLPKTVTGSLAKLSAYYTGARYPNSGINRPSVSITAKEAADAIATARSVLISVKKHFAKRS